MELAVENIIQKEIKLPISIQNQNGEYVYSPSSEEVNLLIRGSESQVNQIDLNQFIAVLDVSELSEGEFTLPIKIIKPEQFEIVSNEPEKIKIKISKR